MQTLKRAVVNSHTLSLVSFDDVRFKVCRSCSEGDESLFFFSYRAANDRFQRWLDDLLHA